MESMEPVTCNLTIKDVMQFEDPECPDVAGLFTKADATSSIESLQPDMFIIKAFAQAVQAHLYNIAIADRLSQDCFTQVLIGVLAKPPTLSASESASRNLKLLFFGPISITPIKGSIGICKAFGVTFYMAPMASLNADAFCPA